jgi:phosphonate transport system ATP-binding protein
MTDAVRLRGVHRTFGGRAALSDVDLTVRAGERVALLGASGAGKSTLLALLNGSLRPTGGTVEVLGHDLGILRERELRRVQARVGAVSQRLDLVEQVRVLHNVNAGRLARWSAPRALLALLTARVDAEAADALARVGLAWAAHQPIERLSGGERQRVALARVIVQRPDLVVADEPVSSLDPARAAEMLDLLSAVTSEGTLVVSLHQPELARRHCDRVVGLREGRVVVDSAADAVEDGTLRDLYALR